jgi:hypothetical protein
MDKLINQEVTYNSSTSEVVIRKKSRKIKGRFSPISPINNEGRKYKNMSADIFDLLDMCSKHAFSVFNNLKFHRSEETNISRYVPKTDLNKTERESLTRRVRELKDAGLIRSVKKTLNSLDKDKQYTFKDPRRVWIINPNMLMCTDHEEADHLWDQCDDEEKR